MMRVIFIVVGTVALVGVGVWFLRAHPLQDAESLVSAVDDRKEVALPESAETKSTAELPDSKAVSTPETSVFDSTNLLGLADNKYANGEVPLGDYKYVTDAPKKGYVYLCNARKESNAGAFTAGPWINGSTWNFLEKISVSGTVSWPNAVFSAVVSGLNRVLTGNGLPKGHTTGTYPVQKNDPAYNYDRNPNSIQTQTLNVSIPKNPTYSETPYCMGGEAGVMLTGVPLFNAFDAGLRDAVANEVQDSCGGHPQVSGQYHYHGLSPCFKDVSVETVLGYAYDGFPITGPKVAENKFLTTEDLDICHGILSEVVLDGKRTRTYHYVMTQDFPYSVSCFRGKPATTGPSAEGGMTQQGGGMQGMPQGGQGGQPPAEAQAACSGKGVGVSCSFKTPMNDTITGTCGMPGGTLACLPS